MHDSGWTILWRRGCAALVLSLAVTCRHATAEDISLVPSSMLRIATVDERFQSYNIEMAEVTGGPFWKPYGARTNDPHPELFSARPPKDLGNARLRKLAAALSPAFMRVSGTWANTTFFAEMDAPKTPPTGFKAVLTHRQWQGVVDFSRAVDAPIVTSFAISAGARDAHGVWKSEQARRLLAAARAMGGHIAAAEFTNEPDLAAAGVAPDHYDAAAYGRDFSIFRAFMKQEAPGVLILGPGASGVSSDASSLFVAAPDVDVTSYHYYGALSKRCGGQQTAQAALSEAWLSRTDQTFAFYRTLRDRLAPGKPIWLTETAEAACGGNPWSSAFLDTFRYLDQLGRLAKAGVQIVMHNTLAASDYGLLDEQTFMPRPNYWGALLWRQLMGQIVLEPGVPIQNGLHVYAHCQRRRSGGVTLLVINNSRSAARRLVLPNASERYTLDAARLQDKAVRLNGHTLSLDASGELPQLPGVSEAAGPLTFAPATITFLVIPGAGNGACQ
jgi:Glycosyl hydrolase family 79, N-terminal domain